MIAQRLHLPEVQRLEKIRRECIYCKNSLEHHHKSFIRPLGAFAVYWSLLPEVPGQLSMITKKHEASGESIGEGVASLRHYHNDLNQIIASNKELLPAIYNRLLNDESVGEVSERDERAKHLMQEALKWSDKIRGFTGKPRIVVLSDDEDGFHSRIDYVPGWTYTLREPARSSDVTAAPALSRTYVNPRNQESGVESHRRARSVLD